MSLEASSILQVVVKGDGIVETTKALEQLAAAGDKAEKGTTKLAKAATDSSKVQIDAAQQAADKYNATIDQMTVAAEQYYSNIATKVQQELFDGMAMMDKLYAHGQDVYAQERAAREQAHQDILAKQQKQMDAAIAASEKVLAKEFDAYQQQKRLEAQSQTKTDDAAKKAMDTAKLKDAQQALREETDRLAKAQEQLEKLDYSNWIARGKAATQSQREQESALLATQKAEQQLKSDGEAFVAQLKRQADTVGMNTKELREYNAEQLRAKAAQLGVSQQVEQHIQTLQKAKGPHESFNLLTAGSARELMVLGHELSQGSFQRFGGSLIVLAERINFLPSLLEKAGAAAASMGIGVGVMFAIITAGVATIAAFGIAISKGAQEQRDFANALILTGNYAGMTTAKMDDLAHSAAKAAGGGLADAKKTVIELASSGKFTGEQIQFITQAVVEFEHATGQSGDEIIKNFEKLAEMSVSSSKRSTDAISQHVLALNDHYHFLSAAQFEHISILEKEGHAQEALDEVEKAYAASVKTRAEEVKQNLGTIQSVWMDIKTAAGEAWDAMLGIGKKTTAQDEVNRVYSELAHMDNQASWISGKGTSWGGKSFDEARLRLVHELNIAQKALDDENDRAAKQADDAQKQQAGAHAIARTIAVERLTSKKTELALMLEEQHQNDILAKQAIEISKLSKDPKERLQALKAEQMFTDEAIAKRDQAIKDHYNKQKNPHGEGLSGLDKTLAGLSERYEVEKRGMDNRIKLIDFEHQHKILTDEEAQELKDKILDKELIAEKQYLTDSIQAITDFHTKDVRLANDAEIKKHDLQKKLGIVQANIGLKQDENDMMPDIQVQAELLKQQKTQDDVTKSIEKQTLAVQAQVDAYNNLPESVKAAGISQKQMVSEVEQSKINSLIEERSKLLANDNATNITQNTVRLLQIDREIQDRTKLMSVEKEHEKQQEANQAALNRSSKLTSIAATTAEMWKSAANEIDKALTQAFGNGGAAAGKMFKAFADSQSQQIMLADKLRKTKESDSLTEIEKRTQIDEINKQSAMNQIGAYGQMADAAKGFFEQGSKGYQAMQRASQIMHAAEIAMALASIPAKLAAGAATMFAQSGWGAFAGIAAMTAVVASFGVAVSGGSSGGMSSADQQKIQGTGSILGSPTITEGNKVELVGAKSDSIAKSLTTLEKNSGLGLVDSSGMLDALNKLNDNISSFAKMIVQTTGITGVTATSTLSGIAGSMSNLAGGFIGKVLGTIGNAIFGGKTTTTDTGFTMSSASLAQIIANGVNASQYTNTTTSGGLFSSDKHNTTVSSLGAATNDQFAQVILNMSSTLQAAAKQLGVDGTAFNSKLNSFVVDIGNVSLKGMTGDQIQQTLQNIFSKLGDDMASYAFSDFKQFQKIGEGMLETVSRVANDLQQVNDVFTALGQTLPVTLEGIANAESLISSFGTVDKLTKGVKSYMDSIYSDQDKLAVVINSVNDQFKALNITGITTKAQFKQLVDSLDLTKQKDIDLFHALMNLAPAFGQVADAAQKAATDMADAAQKAAADMVSNLISDVDNAYNALAKIIDRQKKAIQDKATADKAAAQLQLDAANTTKTAIDTVFSSITNAMKSTSTASVQFTKAQREEAQAYIAMAASLVKAGADPSKLGGLDNALTTIQQSSESMFSTYTDYATDQAKTANSLGSLQDATKQQVDYAQLTIDRLNATIKAIDDNANAQIKTLDDTLSNAQDQVDALKGQSNILLSIDQGIKALNLALLNANGNSTIAGGAAINDAYQKFLGRTPDTAGLAFWKDRLDSGASIDAITSAIANSPEAQIQSMYHVLLGRSADAAGLKYFMNAYSNGGTMSGIQDAIASSAEHSSYLSSLPSFDVGTNNIPFDMVAKVHKGEAIVPAADNAEIKQRLKQAANNDDAGSSAGTSEKLDHLASTISSGDLANVQVAKELLKLFKRFDQDGLPPTRTAY